MRNISQGQCAHAPELCLIFLGDLLSFDDWGFRNEVRVMGIT